MGSEVEGSRAHGKLLIAAVALCCLVLQTAIAMCCPALAGQAEHDAGSAEDCPTHLLAGGDVYEPDHVGPADFVPAPHCFLADGCGFTAHALLQLDLSVTRVADAVRAPVERNGELPWPVSSEHSFNVSELKRSRLTVGVLTRDLGSDLILRTARLRL